MSKDPLRAEEIFGKAIEIESDEERDAYLIEACADCPELYPEIVKLVENYFQAGAFLQKPAALIADMPDDFLLQESVGTVVGSYKLLEQIGEGGMGIVFVAEQTEPIRRNVALKIIKPGMDSREVIARFEAERQALALMSHPHIAKVFDGGATRSGRPYFVMELVKGIPITTFCDQHQLGMRERLELFIEVCQAVQHAHLKGVIHRDLKPSNVLVELHDVTPVPKVIDFGVAKAINHRLTEETIYTRFHEMIGTPLYMSPEQAEFGGLDVDTRTDVYSLGVLLYELLTGTTPFARESLVSKGYDEMRRIIREDEPLRPSRRVSSFDHDQIAAICDHRQTDLRTLSQSLHRELDWIVMKTLEKDRTRRYESATALGEDIRRFLDDESVQACPPSTMYRLRKSVRRNRTVFLTSAIIIPALVIGTVVSTVFGIRANRARLEADGLREISEEKTAVAESEHYRLQLLTGRRALREGRLENATRLLDAVPSAAAGWETERLLYEAALRPYRSFKLAGHDWSVLDAEMSPDGRFLATSGADGQLLLWNVDTGKQRAQLDPGYWDGSQRRWRHALEQPLNAAQRSSDPEQHACVSDLCWLGGEAHFANTHLAVARLDGSGEHINVETAERRTLLQSDTPLYCVASDHNATHILFGDAKGAVTLCTTEGRQLSRQDITDSGITVAVWWDAAEAWIVGAEDGSLHVLTGDDLQRRATAHVGGCVWDMHLFEEDDADQLVVACEQPTLFEFTANAEKTTLQIRQLFQGNADVHEATGFHSVRITSDGRRLIGLNTDGYLTGWNRDTRAVLWTIEAVRANKRRFRLLERQVSAGQPPALPFRRVGRVCSVPSPSETLVAGADTAATLWRLVENAGVRTFATGSRPRISFDPRSSELLWSVDESGGLRVFDATTQQQLAHIERAHAPGHTALIALPSGGVATVGFDGRLRTWSWDGVGIIALDDPRQHERPLLSVTASHDGRWLAAVDVEGNLVVWSHDDSTTPVQRSLVVDDRRLPLTGKLAFNCDDTLLAAFGPGQQCQLFKAPSFRPLEVRARISGTGGTAMLWHPHNPEYLLFADDSIRYADLALNDCTLAREKLGLLHPKAKCVALTADSAGKRWFTLEESGRFIVLEPTRLGEVLERQTTSGAACDLAINRSGTMLAVAHIDGTVELWDADPAHEPSPTPVHNRSEWAMSAVFENKPAVTSDPSRCIQLDEADRLCMVLLEKQHPEKRWAAGRLFYCRETSGGMTTELIAENVEVEPAATSLQFDSGGHPLVVYRRKETEVDPYNGSLHLVTRKKSGNWHDETLVAQGNIGFYPAVRMTEAGVTDVLHFDFGPYRWLRTFRTSTGWQTTPVGRQGDGQNAWVVNDQHGRLHCVFRTNRTNSDLSPPAYLQWDGDEEHREIPDPLALMADSITVDPDGRPLINFRRAAPLGIVERFVGRPSDAGWEFERLPTCQHMQTVLACGADGKLRLAAWYQDHQQIVLWTREAGGWEAQTVGDRLPEPPNFVITRLDSRGLPVVIAGVHKHPTNNWIHVYRSE